MLRCETSARAFLVMATAGDPRLGGEDFDREPDGVARGAFAARSRHASGGFETAHAGEVAAGAVRRSRERQGTSAAAAHELFAAVMECGG